MILGRSAILMTAAVLLTCGSHFRAQTANPPAETYRSSFDGSADHCWVPSIVRPRISSKCAIWRLEAKVTSEVENVLHQTSSPRFVFIAIQQRSLLLTLYLLPRRPDILTAATDDTLNCRTPFVPQADLET